MPVPSKKFKYDFAACVNEASTAQFVQRTQREADALKQQAKGSWQLRCTCGDTLRVLLLSGSYTGFALNRAIAEAFGVGAGCFEPHVNKGSTKEGSLLVCGPSNDVLVCSKKTAAGALGKAAPLVNDRSIKVCQLLETRGDKLTFHSSGIEVEVVVDGVSRGATSKLLLPRCVGADRSFEESSWERLKIVYKGDRSISMRCAFGMLKPRQRLRTG